MMNNQLHIRLISLLLLIAGTLVSPFLQAQDNNSADELLLNLKKATADSSKVAILIDLSKEYSQTELSSALKYAESAYEIAGRTRDNKLISKALLNIGNVYYYQGLFDIALEHYYRYLEIQRKEGNTKEIAFILINLGAINLELKDFTQAKKNFEESLQLLGNKSAQNQGKDQTTAILTIYNNLGILYQELNDKPKALSYYLKGIEQARLSSEQDELLSKLLNNTGVLYLEKLRYNEALEHINEALQIRLKTGDKTGQAQSYFALAKYYRQLKKHSKSLEYLYKSYDIANAVGNIALQAEISESLFNEYYRQDKPDSALKYQLLLKRLSEQMNFDEAKKAMTKIELANEYNQKEKIRKMEQEKKEAHSFLISVSLILLLIIISLLYFLSRNRLKSTKLEKDIMQLASKNLELEKETLAKELEIKNKELTTNVMYLIQKNEFLTEISERIKTLSSEAPEEIKRISDKLVTDLNRNSDDKIWKEFEVRFQEVHLNFYQRLNDKFPQLSPNEKKLAAFLRLNMSTKDISAITFQSTDSIRIARSRLRKKFNLQSGDNIIAFLENI